MKVSCKIVRLFLGYMGPCSLPLRLQKWPRSLAEPGRRMVLQVDFQTNRCHPEPVEGRQQKTIFMSKLHFTTKHANAATVQRNWYVVDGTNQTVGRMCARIAAILRGKNKAYYTPHVDCGDNIIVINCDKVVLTGNKMDEKVYDRYSGYPGGRKEETAKDLLKRRPEVIIERAVKGMLPKNRLGRQMYKKLYVYAGGAHPHTAQQPKELKF
jgi:large subunit ribosomal protein L13